MPHRSFSIALLGFTFLIAGVASILGCGTASDRTSAAPTPAPGTFPALPAIPSEAADPPAPTSPLDFTLRDITGQPYDLGRWRGHVVMIVNVASRCHFTPQYAGLEALYERYRTRGLVVIGVPANSFWNQEPGTESDIQHFCTGVYHVTFPMMAKVEVTGSQICPLYRYLITRSPYPGAIGWNFIKFLVDRQGHVVGRFGSFAHPDDADVVTAVERALGPASPAMPPPAAPATSPARL